MSQVQSDTSISFRLIAVPEQVLHERYHSLTLPTSACKWPSYTADVWKPSVASKTTNLCLLLLSRTGTWEAREDQELQAASSQIIGDKMIRTRWCIWRRIKLYIARIKARVRGLSLYLVSGVSEFFVHVCQRDIEHWFCS
ncbi:hypothetical protein MPTK1_6g06280 [Marchantia polymorpha subsp. ruderalis]|uniref:Uncharacterized protein n=2 Tax=Marchantia polymorpha TaxID=3197 RepID=A0AAF6BP51_MARPO|nr:hypothetical protein MARPO_0097s0016 [Marchantia polymorpha]BBN13785.1 hypothetical protein Mp_6g06280 [Marchantia polymorpha subsp. ruderalis]|eukprot:PTQ32529.1 hypothetical protein MARPO_0097s0016 [Marchantia polymorpha]